VDGLMGVKTHLRDCLDSPKMEVGESIMVRMIIINL
jgi:hypothetical protein